MLDDPQEIQQRDSQGMLAILGSFDRQLQEALAIANSVPLKMPSGTIRNVVIIGMGGSAIGGDLIRSYLGGKLKIPCLVNRNYSGPGFLDASTLVIACSYSGNTEETLSDFSEAVQTGARLICVSSNGELKRLAEEQGVCFIQVPEGYPPRAALAYTTVPALVALGRLGLAPDCSREIEHSVPWVRRRLRLYGPDTPAPENAAKTLALRLQGHIPVVYGSQDHLDAVALRWKGQICENAKQLAFFGSLPEMNHNEIVGWKNPSELLQRLLPVFLRDHEDHPRIQVRAEITRDMLAQRAGGVLEFWSDGDSRLERLWTLILLGDYASVYLAFLNQENPTPVEPIEALKSRLREYP